jgi:hypothetical protein
VFLHAGLGDSVCHFDAHPLWEDLLTQESCIEYSHLKTSGLALHRMRGEAERRREALLRELAEIDEHLGPLRYAAARSHSPCIHSAQHLEGTGYIETPARYPGSW